MRARRDGNQLRDRAHLSGFHDNTIFRRPAPRQSVARTRVTRFFLIGAPGSLWKRNDLRRCRRILVSRKCWNCGSEKPAVETGDHRFGSWRICRYCIPSTRFDHCRTPSCRQYDPRRREISQILVVRNAGATLPSFAAMSYYALILNRTYKVFLADTMMCGAVVNGLVASPPTGSPEFEDQRYWTNTLTATLYENLDVTSDAFRRLGWNNFQIPWTDIKSLDYDPRPKWGMGNVSHSGRLYLRLHSGRSRELILLGKQDGAGMKQTLQKFLVRSPHPSSHSKFG